MNQKLYYVYIATNKRDTVLYTGITNNLNRRMYEHKNKLIKGFTSKYNIEKLIYSQEFNTAIEAITAEKKIKGWTRIKKIKLIKTVNPEFKDLLL
ncbi:MAG: GIY-YIG nuclease family protein [Candidatus Pacebacteria bacterium]|nr:GIY-YIG nuclease family protein [Candidatus Paceibacterota bacterium]